MLLGKIWENLAVSAEEVGEVAAPFEGEEKGSALPQLENTGQNFCQCNREIDGPAWPSASRKSGLIFVFRVKGFSQSSSLPVEQRSGTDLMLVLLIARRPFLQHGSVFTCQNNLGLCLTQEM